MKRFSIFLPALAAALSLLISLPAGAGDIPSRIFKEAGCTPLMKRKALECRDAIDAPGLRNGVYVYSGTVNKYAETPGKLAARLYLLGFEDVYLSCGPRRIREADPWVRSFNARCHALGMKVYAVRIENMALLVDRSKLDAELALIPDYNAAVLPDERFEGYAADLEVHIAKAGRGYDYLPCLWDAKTGYGVGGANDTLLKMALDCFDYSGPKIHAAGLEINEALNCSYQTKFDEGQLSCAGTPDFLRSCDWVVMMAYFPTAESVWAKSEPALKAAGRGKSVSIAIKTVLNKSNSASLQGKGWAYLMDTMRMLNARGAEESAFRGVDVFNFEGIEVMWEWTSDTE